VMTAGAPGGIHCRIGCMSHSCLFAAGFDVGA
jgi:hypothetical protein